MKHAAKEAAVGEPERKQVRTIFMARAVLLGLLLILTLRLTLTEALRQTISQKSAWLTAAAQGKLDEFPLFVGPSMIFALAAATGCLATLAVIFSVHAGMTRGRILRFVLAAIVIGIALWASIHAANHFNALVGAADLSIALLGGWAVSVLCQRKVLGDSGRRIVIAALVAILAAWTFRGLYQRVVEFPDTNAEYQKNKAQQLQQVGIRLNDEYAIKMFESRMNSMEVSGFISLSNVMAAGMIGLVAVLAGLLVTRFIAAGRIEPMAVQMPLRKGREREPPRNDLSLPVILSVCAGVILSAAIVTTILTGSRGGSILAIICALAVLAGAFLWKSVVRFRRILLAAAFAAFVIAAAVIVGYGIRHHSLPSKSLAFRWHYWTAAVHMIQQFPATGVGLHNFGDYYPAFKLASSPEDVSDPHSFFVRLAAELGIPAALLVAALIAWQIVGSVRAIEGSEAPGTEGSASPQTPGWPAFAAIAGLSALLWTLHFAIADSPFAYNVYLAVFYAVIFAAAGWMAWALTASLTPMGIRVIVLSALVGAVGMLIYDQINMALVTGPVAMLFWILLGLADSYDPPTEARRGNFLLALLACAFPAGILFNLFLFLWLQLHNGKSPWDPAPLEFQYIQLVQSGGDLNVALEVINEAIARAPRSIELRNQRIAVKQKIHLPLAEDIRQILQLDRANARPRIALASPDSDLPPSERAALLQQALDLDEQLPADEPKRLPAAQRAEIKKQIQSLTTLHPPAKQSS